MKKWGLIIGLLSIFSLTFAQSNTIGIRGGWGGEISYQKDFSSANRIELDLGWNSQYLGLTGLYHFVNQLEFDGLAWFYGLGGTVGFVDNGPFKVGVSGNIGVEYNFSFPLQIALDYRPTLYVVPTITPGWTGFAFSARYRF